MAGFIEKKFSSILFRDGQDVTLKEARQIAGMRFGVSRKEFKEFAKELEDMGVARLDRKLRNPLLKKVRE